MRFRASAFIAIAAGTVALATLSGSYHFRSVAVENASRVLEDAKSAERLAAELASLESTVILRADAEVVSGLAASAQESLHAIGLPPTALVRVSPLPAKRLGSSNLVEYQTQLSLQNLTFVQSVTFLDMMQVHNSGLLVTDIRYVPQHGEATHSLWSVDATVRLVGASSRDTPASTTAVQGGTQR